MKHDLTRLMTEPPVERLYALKIAARVIDKLGPDSEDDRAILARQFLATLQLAEWLEQDRRRWRTNEDANGRRI
jgi:hypothetical protein